MRRSSIGFAIALLLVLSASTSGLDTRAAAGSAGPQASEHRFEDFDQSNFDATSITINNRYLPLKPGMRYVYRGSDVRDGKRVPHRVDYIVTDLTKVVDGVRTVVIWDRDYVRDQLEEAELTFFAQDKTGNVWHLGQYSEIYDGKELAGARGFLVGYLEGARAGIMMQAHPQPRTPSYSEGYAPPPIYWTDRARVSQVGKKTTVPAGSYEDVLVTEEFSERETHGFQVKYFAPGVGNVRVGFRGKDTAQEKLELVKVTQLGSGGLAQARAEALEVDKRAKMYGSTPPAEIRPDAAGS